MVPYGSKVLIRFPFRTLFDYFSFAVMAPGGTKIKILKPSCIKPGYYFKTWRRLLQESHLGLQPPGRRSLKAKTRCMSKVFFRPPPVWRCFLSAPFYYFLLFRFWRLLPKEMLFFLSGQHKVASPLSIFCLKPPRIAVVSHVCSPFFNPKETPRRPKGVQQRGGTPIKISLIRILTDIYIYI